MKTDSSCRPKVLAKSDAGSVEFCPDCDVVTLRVGMVSLHLKPEGLRLLSRMLGVAVANLAGPSSPALREAGTCAESAEGSIH